MSGGRLNIRRTSGGCWLLATFFAPIRVVFVAVDPIFLAPFLKLLHVRGECLGRAANLAEQHLDDGSECWSRRFGGDEAVNDRDCLVDGGQDGVHDSHQTSWQNTANRVTKKRRPPFRVLVTISDIPPKTRSRE
jgi:hypothetical protein